MDEEPGAVINRLLEDGDVQIIDPASPPPPLSANVVRHPVEQTLHNFGLIRNTGNKKSSSWSWASI